MKMIVHLYILEVIKFETHVQQLITLMAMILGATITTS